MLAVDEMEVSKMVQPWWCTCALWEMVGAANWAGSTSSVGACDNCVVWAGEEGGGLFLGLGLGF